MTIESKVITLVMFTLTAIGVVMTYSASAVWADQNFHSSTYFLRRQILYVGIGSLMFFLSSYVDPDFLRRHSRFLISIAIVLLVIIFFPVVGRSAYGARRWIRLPFFSFQPVEYAKLTMCVYLSDYLSRKREQITEGSLTVFFAPFAILFLIFALVIAQPDLGSCIFLFLLTGILFFLSGIRFRYILFVTIAAVLVLIVLVWKEPYRMNRITAFLNPWKDPLKGGYQIIQSFIAFGLGGIKGVGLGRSTQKLFYLPQSHTDFIFSIIAEELGLIGAMTVVGLYIIFFFFGTRLALRCYDPFLKFLAFSLVIFITLQALINLLVVVGLVPTKGLPLPFVSYGGTALVFHMISVGLLVAIDKHSNRFSSQ